MDDSAPLRILLLEDDPLDADLLGRELRRSGIDCLCERVDAEPAFLAALSPPPDLILADYHLPSYGALGALRALGDRGLDVPVIVVSGTIGEEAAVECLREGATDYLLKDRLGRLPQAVRNALEQARLRRERREAAEQYHLLFEEGPHPMWVVDGETLRFLEVNREAIRRYGYSREEFLGMSLRDIRPPEDVPAMLEAIGRVMQGEVRSGRRRHYTRQGDLREVSVASHPLVWAGRRALLVVVDDITEQVRAETALLENQRLLQAIVDGTAAEIFATDLDGRYLLANGRFLERLGAGRARILGRRPREVLSEETAQRIHGRDREALSAGAAIEYEEEVVRGGDRRTCLAMRFPLVDSERRTFAVCGIATDVTAVKRLEAQLRQAQKLEAIGQLAGGIAHDFNNLLTVVLGYTESALDGPVDGELRHSLAEIEKAGERAAALVRQLLAFSRGQALTPAPVDLNAVVAGLEGMLGRLLGEQVEVSTVMRALAGRVVIVDRGQLEQVIVNLAVNARDAMPDGGILLFETADVELDASYVEAHPEARAGTHAVLSVSDTGVGMDAEIRARIFEPFFTTKEQGKGTGLGLSTVYGIVRQSGGHLEVESEPGGGTTFRIYLPSTELAAASDTRQELPARARAGTETVLLVEDDPALRELIQTWLEDGGYGVLTAASVSACLELARDHRGPVHLLLTDFVLPETRGTEFALRLARVRPEARVLYMSGYEGPELSRGGKLPPAARLLTKPFTQAALLTKMREALDDAPRA
jgi:two-component system cell cycle sensor histidine kinase/response regulator CckA